MGTEYAWLRWSVLAMCCFASNNFLLSVIGKLAANPAEANAKATVIIWMVSGACGILGAVLQGPRQLVQGMKGPRNFALIISGSLVNATAMMMLTLALASDPDSAGPITAVLPLNALIVSALCWYILGETLGLAELAGIAIACLGPMLMSLADDSTASLRGVGFGAATALGFGVSNSLRKVLIKRGCSGSSIVVVFYLTIGFCSVLAVLIKAVAFQGTMDLESLGLVVCAIGSGILWVLGGLCFQWALVGKAGLAASVTNLNSMGVLALQHIFFHPELNGLKILGMVCCLSGVTLLTLKPHAVLPDLQKHLLSATQIGTSSSAEISGCNEAKPMVP
mmetsp:Transcript_63614/g.186072  ORF Transcript_63614/g.186072 Transcript_63614/m.186072 type:complete len:336 (-) Transcript_63614:326-1333(-)